MLTLLHNADLLFQVDPADTVLRDAALVLEDDTIVDVGPADAVLARHQGSVFDQRVDMRGRAITPGFIDSHVHLSETLSRAVFPDHLDTRTWVFHWAKPFYAHVNPDDERISVLLGAAEMLRSGTTCFLDMGAQNDPGITARAVEQAGLRGIVGRHAADVPPDPLPAGWSQEMVRHHFFDNADAALAVLQACVEQWHGYADGRVRCWVNIEGKEPCSLELHVGARALAEKLGVGTTYHLATSIEEAHICERRHGVWPISRIARAGGLGANLVIAHGSAVNDEEVALLAHHDTRVAFCPGTSLKLGKGATRIGRYPEMIAAGVTVGLGTDGVSASGNLSLMRQMYTTAGLFKDARNDPTLIGARQALRMATIDGARALHWADALGSLEPGKKADFVVFDLGHVEWTPYTDPLQALVWSATTASIEQTWVGGRALYRDGRVQSLDEPALFAEARERAAQIVHRAGLDRADVQTTTSLYQ